MTKKDLGLLLLIVVVGIVVAIINPRFLLPINLANTANLIGLFGILSIGQAFVIITGGIELSVGSLVALLGVLFVDFIAVQEMSWMLALPLILVLGAVIGAVHGWLITRLNLQPFVVTLCGLLIYRGAARFYTADGTAGFAFGQNFPDLEFFTAGRFYGVPNTFIALVIIGVAMWVVLHRSVFGRYLYAIGKNEEAARYSGIRTEPDGYLGLCHLRTAYRAFGGLLRDVHALDLAREPRPVLRALRDRRGRVGRLFASWRRGIDRRRRAWHRPAPGVAESRQSAGHPLIA
jgi:ribose transport system permease protein